MARYDALAKCPACGSIATMAEVKRTKDGKKRYLGRCKRELCANHRLPEFRDMFDTEQEAAAAWNGGAR